MNNLNCQTFVGGIGYADGICLLGPSYNAIQTMLSICESYGAEYKVKLNSDKSHFVYSNTNKLCIAK